jgi:TolB protein
MAHFPISVPVSLRTRDEAYSFLCSGGDVQRVCLVAADGRAAASGRNAPDEEFVADVTGAEDSVFSVAVPVFATPQAAETAAGNTQALARQMAEVIVTDLRNSRRFQPTGPGGLNPPSYGEVQAPAYGYWQGSGADNLIQGYVQANANGTLTVGCYLYDVASQTQVARQGFVVQPGEWRRAAHRCADTVYRRMSGDVGFFDTRVVYVRRAARRAGGASSWR